MLKLSSLGQKIGQFLAVSHHDDRLAHNRKLSLATAALNRSAGPRRREAARKATLTGAATGALYDADRLDTGDEAIAQFGASVRVGGNALLAETVEDTTEPLDTFVSGMGGTIVRRPLDEVVAELEAQQAAAEEADRAARQAIRKQKRQERKETFQQRADALKAKFHNQ